MDRLISTAKSLQKKAVEEKHVVDKEEDKRAQRIGYLNTGLLFFDSYFKYEESYKKFLEKNTKEYEKVKNETREKFHSLSFFFKQIAENAYQELKKTSDDEMRKELSIFASTCYQCASVSVAKVIFFF